MSFQFALLTFITLVGAAKSIEIVDDDLIGARRPSPILLSEFYLVLVTVNILKAWSNLLHVLIFK